MDWSGTLRAFRARAKMKQEVAASKLGVSQAYISRVEAGITQPSAEVADRIMQLLTTPEHRPRFDLWVMTVVHSPHPIALLRHQDGELRLQAVSRGLQELGPPFDRLEPGTRLDEAVGMDAEHDVKMVLDSGLLDGRTACMELAFTVDWEGRRRFFSAVCVPVRDDVGGWYVHATPREITEREFEAWSQSAPDNIRVHKFPERAASD
ncbi:helix-turn-helix domain-containing protein [Marinicauda salina]|nr:helix-turn-helix domain-containing protein [Marinicauda salina]